MKYAILDTQDGRDNAWLGDERGPTVYYDEELARAAATIINEQFNSASRFRAKPLPDYTSFRHLDEVKPFKTVQEAIEQIEKGH